VEKPPFHPSPQGRVENFSRKRAKKSLKPNFLTESGFLDVENLLSLQVECLQLG